MTTRTLCLVGRRALLGASIAVWFAALSPPLLAANCSIAATATSFAVYNVFAASPNNNGVGSLTIDCQGVAGTVALTPGGSNSYAARMMTSGSNRLNYNLYTSAARNVIWGDGAGASSTMTAAKNTITTLNVFGQIPAGQDAAVGTYTDSIIAIVNF